MDEIKNAYDQICFKWCSYREKMPINKCIIDFAKQLKEGSSILDVGCGSGVPISAYLANNGFKVTGIDISSNMIKKAKSLNLPNSTFIVDDVLTYNPHKSFDAIIAFDSLWHIKYSEQSKIYSKIASLLNKDGLFIFTHGKSDGEIMGTMFGESFYYSALSTETVKKLLEENGFIILSLIENYKEKSTGERDLLVIAKKII